MESDVSETRVITASSDRVVRIFKANDNNLTLESEISGFKSPVTKAIFLNLGELICVSCYTGDLYIFKLEGTSYSKKYEKKIFEGSINAISHLWLDDRFKVFCGCSDGNLLVIEFDSRFNTTESRIFCHRFGVSCVSSNQHYLVTGGIDYSTIVFDLKEMKELARNKDHKALVRDVSVCNIGEFDIFCFASCSDDGRVIVYNKIGNIFNKQVIEIHQPVYSLSWSKTGYSLSVGYGDSEIKHFVPDISGIFKEVPLKKA